MCERTDWLFLCDSCGTTQISKAWLGWFTWALETSAFWTVEELHPRGGQILIIIWWYFFIGTSLGPFRADPASVILCHKLGIRYPTLRMLRFVWCLESGLFRVWSSRDGLSHLFGKERKFTSLKPSWRLLRRFWAFNHLNSRMVSGNPRR